ncbi:MAG TPA: cache domain-containing protein, partial [Bacillota bacterium]|nr:cache domain-containing protein [Bacillota bacterium]
MKSLKFKLLFMFIPIVILSLGTIAYINHQKAEDFLQTNFQNEANIKLRFIQSKIDDWTVLHKDELSLLAESDQLKGKQPTIEIPYLQSIVQKNSDYEMFFVSNDLKGQQAYTSLNSTVDISDRDYFKQSIQGKTVVSDPLISKVTGKMVLVISTPIYQNSQVTGVVGATVLIDKLVDIINTEKLGRTGYPYIYNKDGIVLVHPNKDQILKLNLHTLNNEQL